MLPEDMLFLQVLPDNVRWRVRYSKVHLASKQCLSAQGVVDASDLWRFLFLESDVGNGRRRNLFVIVLYLSINGGLNSRTFLKFLPSYSDASLLEQSYQIAILVAKYDICDIDFFNFCWNQITTMEARVLMNVTLLIFPLSMHFNG